jgi:hypothetical protein
MEKRIASTFESLKPTSRKIHEPLRPETGLTERLPSIIQTPISSSVRRRIAGVR